MMNQKWQLGFVLSFVLIYRVVDVSAQGSCTITPLNPTTLTATGGALPNRTMNVRIQCVCTGTSGQHVRWYDINTNFVFGSTSFNYMAGSPYYIRNNPFDGDNDVTLVIPTFNDSYDGTYNCGIRVNNTEFTSPSAAVTLTITVPNLTVSITAPNTQTVGQSLTLQCEVTTVRHITSRVDIVWSSGGVVLDRMNNVSSTTMDNPLVYTDSYTISQLSTTDDGREIQCEVVINTSPSVMATDSLTLDVTVPTPTVTIIPSGPIQGAMVGSSQNIQCTVSTVSGVESNSVMISWMGPGGNIMNNSRVTISPTTSSGNTYTSSLQFTYLMEGDEGTYTCNVMILETSRSQSVELQSFTNVQNISVHLNDVHLQRCGLIHRTEQNRIKN